MKENVSGCFFRTQCIIGFVEREAA